MVNDGSQLADLQVIVDADQPAHAKLPHCNTGSSVEVRGTLKESPGKGQKFEVHAKEIDVYGEAEGTTYPLQKKGHSLEFLRDIGHLRPRTNAFGAVFRIRNLLAHEIHNFFQERGFLWIHTPILTASDCEGAGEMFTVTHFDLDKDLPRDDKGKVDYSQDFFGEQANLTVSGQLNAETLACGLGDVYTFGPTFRAENSNTSRHLAEFWMVEPEMAFCDLKDNADLAEDFLKHLFKKVLDNCEDDLAFLSKLFKGIDVPTLQNIVERPFTTMTYTDAVRELESCGQKFEFPVEWGIDLQSEHERYLTDEVIKGPVTVVDYPKDIKAFYMRRNDDGKTVAAMDVLAPRIGEIIGGSQREERWDELHAGMKDHDIPADEMYWYTDLRRYGTVPHAGFGLGFERLVQYVTGMGNIRDTIPFPRARNLIKF